MGCTVSKVHSNFKSETVSLNKNINGTVQKVGNKQPEQEAGTEKNRTTSIVPDSRIQLTLRQKFQVLKSLKGIERNITVTGVKMFLSMFEQNREVLKLFGDFANYTAEELVENRELEQHVTMVMNTIVEAISCLEDIDYVICMLHSIGKLHAKKMKNFDPQEFWKIEEPFLSAVKETLDDRYTANMDIIYKITIKFILETLIEGFNYNTTV